MSLKPEEVFTGEWSVDEDGFYHLLSGGISDYSSKLLLKLKTMRANRFVLVNYNLPSLVKMNNDGATYICGDARLDSLVEMDNQGETEIFGYARLDSLVEINNQGNTRIDYHVPLPLLKKPKAKFVMVRLDKWYGCRTMEIKDWDSFYSELRAVTEEFHLWFSFFHTKDEDELLSPDEFLSFIKLSGV